MLKRLPDTILERIISFATQQPSQDDNERMITNLKATCRDFNRTASAHATHLRRTALKQFAGVVQWIPEFYLSFGQDLWTQSDFIPEARAYRVQFGLPEKQQGGQFDRMLLSVILQPAPIISFFLRYKEKEHGAWTFNNESTLDIHVRTDMSGKIDTVTVNNLVKDWFDACYK